MNVLNWISAFRLKTLPLALASIILGNFIAFSIQNFSPLIGLLSILTSISLQILSNLANDYGDAVNGVDNENRVGPARAVQSGLISAKKMKNGIYFFILLSLTLGISLLYLSFGATQNLSFLLFFILGLFAIAAAIKYTVGKKPYGYMGLGDFFVFLFFGWVAVLGTIYLHSQIFEPSFLLPASSIGFLAVGVLNLNNMRDAEQDKKVGKKTLAVILGNKRSKIYHFSLILLSFVCAVSFGLQNFTNLKQGLCLLAFTPILAHLVRVLKIKVPANLNPELKKLALSTFLFSIIFGAGICFYSF